MNVISREALEAWLNELGRARTLVAPKTVKDVLLYRPVDDIRHSAALDPAAGRPAMSIKDALFPPTERLMLVERVPDPEVPGRRAVRVEETLPEGEQVIVGVRPCDARGMRALDAAFLEHAPADPYYARRRANTTLIGMACAEMGPSCFCRSVGGAPDDPSDVDVFLTALEDGYAVQAVTDKGRVLLGGTALQEAEGARPKPGLCDPVPVPDTLAWPAYFDDAFWGRMSERCLSCRACSYVCPTCRCFDVRDELLPSQDGIERYERIRCWDACAGEPYRRIAGGHNPRAEEGQRLRNRFFCKFYYYPQQYGPVACTGCGRCIDVCPVNVDITEVLTHLVTG
jgi:sulfhydrogenase subunit beta (sulfur reductase)